MDREEAVERTLTTLRFFWNSPQGTEKDATGYKGFYYHFLDMKTGKRAWKCELSTIDTAVLIAGALVAGQYFDHDKGDEAEIRDLAEKLYARVDWRWAQNQKATVAMGWKPESGFLSSRWEGYDEAILLYLLGLGSPTHRLTDDSYEAFTQTYAWKEIYGRELLYAGPLFIHQFTHIWIDFRDLQDAYMRDRGTDYFRNSCEATYIHQEYAIRNPQEFNGHGEYIWGLTASDGPGPKTIRIDGVERRFYGYIARGVPYGPDDGTIAPWAVVASLPFSPRIVLDTIEHFDELKLKETNPYGYKATYNPTYPDASGDERGWISPYHYGINQGPIVLMIENHCSEFVWRLTKRIPYFVDGLRRAGFTGGWLD
jgi:hypothetical protein